MDQKFFSVPFASGGDTTPIPNDTQPSGEVSFTQGWGFDYQRELGTDPLAKPIERAQTNYLFNSITGVLAQYQRSSVPEFITTADNGGTPFSYAKGVMVRYRATPSDPFATYVSKVDTNAALPSDATKWQPFLFEEATQAQAEAGTDATTVMTARRVKQAIAANGGTVPSATTTTAGITRYATAAEAQAQSVTNAAVTPVALVPYARTSGADFTGHINLRGAYPVSTIQMFDNNNDVQCLQLGSGYNTTTDRNGFIINRNAGGSIYLSAGNLLNKLLLSPSNCTLDSAFYAGGQIASGTAVISYGRVVTGQGAAEGTYQFGADGYYIYNNAGAIGIYDGAGGTGVAVSFTKSNAVWSFRGQLVPIGGFQNGSSRELKTEGVANTYGLDAVLKLETRIATYHDWVDPNAREQLFLIAENVAESIPHAVRDDVLKLSPTKRPKDARYFKTLDNLQITVALVKAVQEENAQRREENEQLRRELAQLRELVEKMSEGR